MHDDVGHFRFEVNLQIYLSLLVKFMVKHFTRSNKLFIMRTFQKFIEVVNTDRNVSLFRRKKMIVHAVSFVSSGRHVSPIKIDLWKLSNIGHPCNSVRIIPPPVFHGLDILAHISMLWLISVDAFVRTSKIPFNYMF